MKKTPKLYLATKYNGDANGGGGKYSYVVTAGRPKRSAELRCAYPRDIDYDNEVFWPCDVALAALGLTAPTKRIPARVVTFRMLFVKPTVKVAKRKTARRSKRK